MAKKKSRQYKSSTNSVPPNTTPITGVATLGDVKSAWNDLFKMGAEKAMGALGFAYTNSPYIQNQRAKKVSSQAIAKKRAQIESALQDPQNSEQSLREISQSLYSNYSLLKLNNLYSDILTYRNYFYSKYTNSKDIKSKEYKAERKKLSKWLDRFQPKRTFQNIILKAQREGKVAFYMRDSVVENENDFDYAYLQEIPSDYLKIVGWNTASKFSIMFDFTYFWQPGTSPLQFPPIFKKYYDELNALFPNGRISSPNINPNDLPPEVQIYYKDTKWFYWRTLPFDECFVFSQDESQPYQLPNSAGLFLQASDLQDYSYLQQELLQLPLSGVVMGTLPLTKDSGGTVGVDQYAIGSEAFSFFTDMFNQVAPKGIQLFLTPATNHEFFKFDGDIVNNSLIVTNAIQQFNSIAGIGGLNTTSDKPNMAQVKTAQIMEAAYVAKFYPQFENCINTWWENKLKTKYTWKFKIKGSKFEDQSDFPKVEKGLSLGQNYLLPEYLSYFDLGIDDAESMQEEIIESKIYDKLQVLQSAFNSSQQVKVQQKAVGSETELGGRTKVDENLIESDGTANSISEGSNTSDNRIMELKHCAECGEELLDKSNYPFCSVECFESNQERLDRGE